MNTDRKRLARPSLRGLLATRRGALIVAVACGAAAIGIIVFALGKYQHSVAQSAQQATVLVATTEIQKGTSADGLVTRRLYRVMPVLASNVAANAIVDAGSLSGKVAATDILPGQQLTSTQFTAGAVGTTTELAPSERAVAVTLDPAHAAADMIAAGDHVDVYGSFQASTGHPVVSLLVPNATILNTADSSSGSAPAGGLAPSGGATGGTVLLAVSEQLGPRVMWMFDNGKVWLELRSANSTNPDPTITGLPQTVLGNSPTTAPTYPAATPTGLKR